MEPSGEIVSPRSITPEVSQVEYPLREGEQVITEYPTFYKNRRVLRIINEDGEDRVIKIRKKKPEADQEFFNLHFLLSSYRKNGVDVKWKDAHKIGDNLVIDMPFLGFSLTELGTRMDMDEMGYEPEKYELDFKGFPKEEAEKLFDQLIEEHRRFAKEYGLIHGDLFQENAPNNIVFNPQYNKLLLIDAEALGEATPERMERFENQIAKAREWTVRSLAA